MPQRKEEEGGQGRLPEGGICWKNRGKKSLPGKGNSICKDIWIGNNAMN